MTRKRYLFGLPIASPPIVILAVIMASAGAFIQYMPNISKTAIGSAKSSIIQSPVQSPVLRDGYALTKAPPQWAGIEFIFNGKTVKVVGLVVEEK